MYIELISFYIGPKCKGECCEEIEVDEPHPKNFTPFTIVIIKREIIKILFAI